MLYRIPTDCLQNLTEFSQTSRRIPAASFGTRDKSSWKLRRIVSESSFSSIQFIARCFREFQTQAKTCSDSDAARRLSRSELGSAAPRPVFRDRLWRRAEAEPPRAHGVELPTGFCLLLRSKPLPLGGHTNRDLRPEASGPVFYSTFFAPGGPKPPKLEVR